LQPVVDEFQSESTIGPGGAAPGKVLDDDLAIVLLWHQNTITAEQLFYRVVVHPHGQLIELKLRDGGGVGKTSRSVFSETATTRWPDDRPVSARRRGQARAVSAFEDDVLASPPPRGEARMDVC